MTMGLSFGFGLAITQTTRNSFDSCKTMKKRTAFFVVIAIMSLYLLAKLLLYETTHYSIFLKLNSSNQLSIDSPVYVNGVQLGEVKKIQLIGANPCIHLKMSNSAQIPVGSSFAIQNVGLASEFSVAITLSGAETFYEKSDTIEVAPLHQIPTMGEILSNVASQLDTLANQFDSEKIKH